MWISTKFSRKQSQIEGDYQENPACEFNEYRRWHGGLSEIAEYKVVSKPCDNGVSFE